MNRFLKWLLFGYSSLSEIDDKTIPSEFNELILIITLQKIFIFSTHATSDFFNQICSKLHNVELYITSIKDEESSDKFQILKISKFIQFTQQVSSIGIPLSHEQSEKIITLEKWPIIGATSLDLLKLGFFTMNHKIIDIRKDVEKLYNRIDLNVCLNLIHTKTTFLESTITDFYMYFEREAINKRLERSEEKMNENQLLEFIRMEYEKYKETIFTFLNDLPMPRVLYGINSNVNFFEGCSTDALYKTVFDFKIPAFHMTYENYDPVTGIRIGRTIFLYNMQEKYLDFDNDTLQYGFIPTLIYKEAFYLFNLYYIIISFSRKYQFDIILNKMNITSTKEMLCKELNSYIMDKFSDNYFDYIISENNIHIDVREYNLLSKSNSNENKVIVLRIELKQILSAHCHRRIGSLLFCDSFLYCYGELFNLTSDILPVKFIMTSTQHFKQGPYNHLQIINSESKIQIKDIEYQALCFYKDEYNIPYIFSDSHEYGLDHNQMFIVYSGRLNLYKDYLILNDSGIGSVIIALDNIKLFSYLEELKYTIMLFEFEDGSMLPLSGIVKKEIIMYFKGHTERYRGYARSIIDALRDNPKMRGKCSIMSDDKKFEYEIIMHTLNETEYDNLNYISNSYNLTNINDVLIEMYEYEYLKYSHKNFMLFSEYKNILTEAEENLTSNENIIDKDKHKMIFIFGSDPRTLNAMITKLADLAKQTGFKSVNVFPPFSLFNVHNSNNAILNYYVEQIGNVSQKGNFITFVCVYHSCNVLVLMNDIINSYSDFYTKYEILNVCYVINYAQYKSGKHKDIINKDYYYEHIVNYILVDEGMLEQEKITKYNSIVTLANPKAKLFNHRSFYLNIKEMKYLLEKKHINQQYLNFYFKYYKDLQNSMVYYQNIFIPFKYMCKEDLLSQFLSNSINIPIRILFDNCNEFPKQIENAEQMFDNKNLETEEEFQTYLTLLSRIDKVKGTQPIFCSIYGNCIYSKDFKPTNEVYTFYANYKEKEVKKGTNVDRSEIGIFILGKNLLRIDNASEYYDKMMLTMAGVFPEMRKYRTKEDISKEERDNLNYANINQPLPPGWELVDAVFIDDNDVIHGEHPDIEKFIEEYIELGNIAIDEYNNKLQSDIDALLI